MDFSFTPEQLELRRAVRDLADDHCPTSRLREVIESTSGYDAGLWRRLAGDLGLAGIALTAASGGSEGSFVDLAIVLEEAGRALLPVPLLGTTIAAAAVERADEAIAGEVLPAVASGATAAALVVGPAMVSNGDRLTGSADHVIDGGLADLLAVATGAGLWLLDATATGVEVRPAPTLDRTRGYASVRFEAAAARPLGDSIAAATAVDLLRVGLAAEAVGLARRCLEMTVEHLKTRVQFGKPIGSFQALQHRCADLAVSLEAATSTAYFAAWAAADSPAELSVAAPLAKSVCTDAAYAVVAETIQLHGGIGFTWEHDAHLYFKRATVLQSLLGGSHAHRQLVATRSGALAGSR